MTSRMTATDELRRLLDERGVEYTVIPEDAYSREYIKIGNIEIRTNNRDEVAVYYLTPEQAVEATLGSDLQAENERLRELVRDIADHIKHDDGFGIDRGWVLDRIRELGIEVDA